jgi:hypothetical protein
MSKADLKIDWATYEAAKYACENWHYSKRIPVNKLLKLGVWESGKFIGVILFGVGSSANLHKPFNLQRTEVCELVRVALTNHKNKVSRMIAICLKFLQKTNPLLRVCVSFADNTQGHYGGIYQAGNWIYTGTSSTTTEYFVKGRWYQMTGNNLPIIRKNLVSKTRKVQGKHRYLMPLDNEMRKRILPLSKPYPKRAGSETTDTAGFQPAEGGSIPTPALHSQAA